MNCEQFKKLIKDDADGVTSGERAYLLKKLAKKMKAAGFDVNEGSIEYVGNYPNVTICGIVFYISFSGYGEYLHAKRYVCEHTSLKDSKKCFKKKKVGHSRGMGGNPDIYYGYKYVGEIQRPSDLAPLLD